MRGRDGEKERERHGGEGETETERERQSTEDLRGRYGDRDCNASEFGYILNLESNLNQNKNKNNIYSSENK